VQFVVAVVHVKEPGDDVTVYPVTKPPPLSVGVAQETRTDASPNTTTTSIGAPGTVVGTTAPDAPEAEPVPALFIAVTVNV